MLTLNKLLPVVISLLLLRYICDKLFDVIDPGQHFLPKNSVIAFLMKYKTNVSKAALLY